MRTFEIALILINLLALIVARRRLPASARLGMAAASLGLLAAHGVCEGPRWQMALAYVITVLLAGTSLAGLWARVHAPRALRAAAAGLALLGLGASACLAYALPVFRLPAPTGSYAVGAQYIHLVDEARSDPFLDGAGQPRELMVKVYYPAKADQARPYLPYFGGSGELIRLFTTGYGIPAFLFDHLARVETHAKTGLPLASQPRDYPLVLFMHGAGTSMEAHTAQCEDLASHGYIVAAIDHPYVSAATVFPGRTVTHHQATTDFATPEPAEIITRIMAEDAQFVLDALAEMNAGRGASIFAGRINLEQTGVIGHSVGGAAAYDLALRDPRVKAAANLDGVVYVTPRAVGSEAPFFMLASDSGHAQALRQREPLMPPLAGLPEDERRLTRDLYGGEEAYQAAYSRARQNVVGLAALLETSGNLFSIHGCDHMHYSDIGLFIGDRRLREGLGIRGETDPARCLAITSAVTVDFFDWYLKGAASRAWEDRAARFAELHRVDLTAR